MNTNSLLNVLRSRLSAAVAQVAGHEADPMLRPAQDPKFGDYQCNVAMSLAKPLKAKPRDVAQRIVDAAGLDDIAGSVELAGPGFINIRLKPEYLSGYLGTIPAPPAKAAEGADDRLGMPPVETPLRVVIDYSCPNIAKQMHVGHLRTTIIGDVFARVLSFEGHEVIRQNHVGDWGTQFGMLIEYYRDIPLPTADTTNDVLAAAEADYKAAQERFSSDPEFADRARAAVARLQGGDPAARKVWEQLCDLSRSAFLQLYKRLGVLLTNDDERGESFYNDRLGPVIDDLRRKLAPGGNPRGELRQDQGAECVFLTDEDGQPQFKNPEGEPLPMIVQKKDGAYLYATTDLAALRFRIEELGAKRIIYVTDSRQKLHFEMLFATARAAGWAADNLKLEHVTFGTVLGPDRKPLKTRSGDTVKLKDLLDEAERRALEVLTNRDEATQDSGDEEPDWQAGGGATPAIDTAIASATADDNDKIMRLAARLLDIPVESINPDDPLKAVNAESLDVVERVMDLEDELGIGIPDD
ncbi:MAG: arginine--tRNA ligase, partial [Phycisphaerae bacterium]|nr:arginine--tRNA ligase [Phycisphaerae bacterium]